MDDQTKRATTSRSLRKILLACLLLGGLFYSWSSIWKNDLRGLDASVFYLAGVTWKQGDSAYDRQAYTAAFARQRADGGFYDRLERSIFISPPTIAPLSLAMASAGWPQAIVLLEAVQIAAFMLLTWACLSLSQHPGLPLFPPDDYTVFVVIVAFCFGAVNATILFRQMSLLALAGGVGALLAWRNGQFVLLCGLLVLASVKPQVSLLFFSFLLGAGAWRAIFTSGAIGLLILLAVEFPAGPADILRNMQGSVDAYLQHPFNADPTMRIGIGGLFSDPETSRQVFLAGILLAAFGTAAMGWHIRRYPCYLVHGAVGLLVLSVLTIPIFTYDFIAGSALLILSRYWRQTWARASVVVALVASSKPNGVETLIITPDLPLLGVLDGRATQIVVIGSLLFVVLILGLATWRALPPE